MAKSPTIGIDPPDRVKTVGFPNTSLNAFAATYRFRWLLVLIGYLSAAVLALVYLKQKLAVIGTGK